MQNKSYIYLGCFFDFDRLQTAVERFAPHRLDCAIQEPHVTFAYRPEQVDPALFGQPVTVRVTGYGNDGRNEGLRVEILTGNSDLQDMVRRILVPHITLSVSREGRAVDTAKLDFSPVEHFFLDGYFGGYRQDGTVVLAG